jgi:hypothetical protein
MTPLKIAATLLLSSLSCLCFASGTTGGATNGNNSQNYSKPKTDPTYEAGKSIFTGRDRNYSNYTFCITDPKTGESSKLTGDSIKAYKAATYSAVAKNLTNCDKPSVALSNLIATDDISYLVYFLDKRYRLQLTR